MLSSPRVFLIPCPMRRRGAILTRRQALSSIFFLSQFNSEHTGEVVFIHYQRLATCLEQVLRVNGTNVREWTRYSYTCLCKHTETIERKLNKLGRNGSRTSIRLKRVLLPKMHCTNTVSTFNRGIRSDTSTWSFYSAFTPTLIKAAP